MIWDDLLVMWNMSLHHFLCIFEQICINIFVCFPKRLCWFSFGLVSLVWNLFGFSFETSEICVHPTFGYLSVLLPLLSLRRGLPSAQT